MSLLAPLFLLGLLAALLPWWLHRLSNEDPPKQDFGSTQFLEASQNTSSKSKRTRYWWLLSLRVLFLGLLCLLFADPVVEKVKGLMASDTRHVLLIDTSLSQKLDGRWQKTLELANNVLDNASSKDEVILIEASDKIIQLETDGSIADAREALGKLTPKLTRLNYGRIATAVRSAVSDTDKNVNLHIVTDTQASALPERFTELAVSGLQELQIHSSASDDDQNTSITGNLETLNDQLANVVAIINHHGEAVTRTVSIMADGSVLGSTSVNLKPDGQTVYRFEQLDLSNVIPPIELTLEPADALADDDRWLLPTPSTDPTAITLLTGNTSASTSATYVSAAIESDPRFSTQQIEADRFAVQDTGKLVIVPDASALSDRAARRMVEHIENGGAALIAVGTAPHAPETINLLGIGTNNDSKSQPLHVSNIDQSHPLTSTLAANWRAVSVAQRVKLNSKITDRVIVGLSDGSALLTERRLGAGKLLVVSTALDTQWSDLPTQNVFVAFILQSIDYLAGAEAGESYRAVGDVLSVAAGTQLLSPNGESMIDLANISKRQLVSLDEAGIYSSRSASGIQSIAVNPDTRESDIAPLTPEVINAWQDIGGSDKNTEVDSSNGNALANSVSKQSKQSLWRWLLPILLALALLESFFSHRHLWIRRKA